MSTTAEATLETPAASTSDQSKPILPSRTEELAARLATLQAAYTAALAVIEQRQQALTDAHAAQDARRQQFAQATADAQTAAEKAIRAGDGKGLVKRAEDRALNAAFRAQQAITAAEATFAALQADIAHAQAEANTINAQMAAIEAALADAQAEEARDALYSEWQALTTQLLDLARRTRAHNAAVASAGLAPGQSSRPIRERTLVLPGHPSRKNPLFTSDMRQAARQGVTLWVASDLASASVSEFQATHGL